ncbi:DUF4388 domain-containing protein [Desulfococcaceae bacterium HSG8]|nr:DUF4388 domain-containing protein [Desulfococcaceae bacterium HSG8]
MSHPETIFKIIEENNCPLYELGDEFKLSGKALLSKVGRKRTFITTSVIKMPHLRPPCRVLIEDLTRVLIKYERMENVEKCVTTCSGCSGLIRIAYNREKMPVDENNNDINELVGLLYIFPIFQTLDENDIEKIVPLLKMKKFAKGATVMNKGDSGSNLYIIISGIVDVFVDDGVSITTLGIGDVFGEISLLVGSPVGATIKVVETARLLYINGKDFRRVLDQFPSIQIYFARLLAKRLAKTNDEISQDISSDIRGNFSQMLPSELLQTLNLNRKTGVLNLELSKGTARISFREGSLIRVSYNNRKGKIAFFEILKEKKGRFKFIQGLTPEETDATELGDFMWLLMEGIRRIEEGSVG